MKIDISNIRIYFDNGIFEILINDGEKIAFETINEIEDIWVNTNLETMRIYKLKNK